MALPRVRENAATEIDTLFERLWNDFMAPSFPVRFETAPALYTPAVDLYEKDGTFVVEMSVPGYKREDIDVEVNGTLLTISGKYGDTKTEEGAKYHYRQIRRGVFTRTITLPQEIEQSAVKATIENGILKVTAKPAKPISSKKIEVTGG